MVLISFLITGSLIAWSIVGVITLMGKLIHHEHMFDSNSMFQGKSKASWGQITFLSLVYGPIWLIILPTFIIIFIIGYGFNRIKTLWKLLSEIGPR